MSEVITLIDGNYKMSMTELKKLITILLWIHSYKFSTVPQHNSN